MTELDYERLLRSERGRPLLDLLHTVLLVLDPAGRIISFNPYMEELSGYSLNEVKGRDWFAVFLPKRTAEATRKIFSGAIRGERTQGNVDSMITKDGRELRIEWYDTALKDNKGRVEALISVGRDVTARVEAEEALRASEERYRLLAEGTDNIPYSIDAAGLVTFIGPQISRFGLEPGKVLGRPFLDFVHSEDRAAVEKDFEESVRTGRAFPSEFRILAGTGGVRWMEELGNLRRDGAGRVTGMIGIIREITARKQAERSLEEAKALMDTVVENVPMMIFLKRAEDLRFMLFNRAGEELLGYDRASLIGKSDMDFFPKEQAEFFITRDRKVLNGETEVLDIPEEPVNTLRKGRRWLHTRKVCIRDPEGRAKYLLGISEDITDRKNAERERQEMDLRLLESQKMESVGRLAGGLAHDFNNLLTTMEGYAGLLLRELPEGDPKKQDVLEILSAAGRAAGLTRQLLAFSRRQMLDPRVIDLNATLGGMLKMLQRLLGETIKLEVRLMEGGCRVKVDPGQMDQVIVNLVMNARDAMPRGGILFLETSAARPDDGFFSRYPDLARAPFACLTVRDTGCGIPDEIRGRIFEPFFTTKDKDRGTGLGLPTVYGIIKQSGGAVEVESEPGRGAAFRVYLPLSREEAVERREAAEKGAILRGSETILFVEDEESLRRLGERILRLCGYTVISAVDGRHALAEAERRGKPVDLLLTDVVMPGMGGRELGLELARRELAARTLYMSGYAESSVVDHGVLAPDIAFIYKPFTAEALSKKLREVLDGPADRARP